MLKAAFHNLDVGKTQSDIAGPNDAHEEPILMPKSQPDASPAQQNEFKNRANPPDRTAPVDSVIELIVFLPCRLEARVRNRHRNAYRTFYRRDVGTKLLPEHLGGL
jgi:hypothetical protein